MASDRPPRTLWRCRDCNRAIPRKVHHMKWHNTIRMWVWCDFLPSSAYDLRVVSHKKPLAYPTPCPCGWQGSKTILKKRGEKVR